MKYRHSDESHLEIVCSHPSLPIRRHTKSVPYLRRLAPFPSTEICCRGPGTSSPADCHWRNSDWDNASPRPVGTDCGGFPLGLSKVTFVHRLHTDCFSQKLRSAVVLLNQSTFEFGAGIFQVWWPINCPYCLNVIPKRVRFVGRLVCQIMCMKHLF